MEEFIRTLRSMDLKVDEEKVKSQVGTGYNVVSLQDKFSPYRADFIVQVQGRIDRRKGSILGLGTYYQSPESLILAKLRMIKATRSRDRSIKDKDDIRAILDNTRVNRSSITRRARTENTLKVWEEMFRKGLLAGSVRF